MSRSTFPRDPFPLPPQGKGASRIGPRLCPLAIMLLGLAAVCAVTLCSALLPSPVAQAQTATPISVGSNEASSGGPYVLTITTTQAVPAGESILVAGIAGGTPPPTAGTCSDSGGNAYSTDVSQSGGGVGLTVLCSTSGIAAQFPSGATITIAFTGGFGGPVSLRAEAFSVSGLASAPLDKTASATGTGLSPSSGATATTAQVDELLFGVVVDAGNSASSAGFNPGTNGTAINCATSGSPTYTSLGGVGSAPPSLFSMYCLVGAEGGYAAKASLGGTNPQWDALIATYRVLAATTTTASNATATFSSSAQNVTLTATVTSTSVVNEGTVTFTIKQGSTVIGSATSGTVVNGAVSVTYALPAGQAPGTYTIQATYNGSTNFAGSADSSHTLTINPVSTTTGLASAPNPSGSGQPVTFTATVTCTGFSTNGETVTFKDNGSGIGTGTLSSGVATFTTSSLGAANHPITAFYPGDSNCAPSTSSTVTQAVGATSCTPASGSTVPLKSSVSCTFQPNTGDIFEGWSSTGTVSPATSSSAGQSFFLYGSGPASITAAWQTSTGSQERLTFSYTVGSAPLTQPTVSCNPSGGAVTSGSTVNCSFVVGSSGATLTGWSASGFTPTSSTSPTPSFVAGPATKVATIMVQWTDAGSQPHAQTFAYSISTSCIC